MIGKLLSAIAIGVIFASALYAQTPEELGASWVSSETSNISSSIVTSATSADEPSSSKTSHVAKAQKTNENVQESERFAGPKTTRYSLELTGLPSADGQFWVVYDLSPYSERLANVKAPQNSIVDWIVFDSGDDFWRQEPFCILSATSDRLYVYHNAKVQRYVSNIVDRFIDPLKKDRSFSIKVVAVQAPEWRLRYASDLSPLKTTIVGNGCDAQGWELHNSELERIASELERRTDYALLSEGNCVVPNGQTFGWATAAPRKTFARDYRVDPNAASGYSTDTSSIDEGFSIETTPLLSTTGETLELLFRYRSTVVEKSRSFGIRVPTPNSPRQQLNVERPAIATCDFRGKIALPRDKAAIVDLGLVPLTPPNKMDAPSGFVENAFNLVSQRSSFYDVLILIGPSN